jgi:hypothetical protein
MSSNLVLDCESFDTALASLAQIFRTMPETLKSLLSSKEIGAHFETHWQELPDFSDYIYAVAERHFGSPLALDGVCWFHTTRVLPGTTFSEGILPLDAALPSLKERLLEAVDDASVREQLHHAFHSGGVGDHHYATKTQNSMHWGPYAILVRDVAFCATNLSQHDYLAMPEIIEDICNGFDEPMRKALEGTFRAKLRPATVKFTSLVDHDDAYIATALCYVHSMIQEGKLDTNSVICFDGKNNPVPPQDILKVEIVDEGQAKREPAHDLA